MATTAGHKRRPVDKFGDRRRELAMAAQATLSEFGYARTSLREIAQRSEFSHGVFHYYFADKAELIAYCVALYKEECATRYDGVVATSTTPEELVEGFCDVLVASFVVEGPMHRLWYDLRNQSLFDDVFRDEVRAIDHSLEQMIWRVVERYAELAGGVPRLEASATYAMLDGLFQQALLDHALGKADIDERLRRDAAVILRALVV